MAQIKDLIRMCKSHLACYGCPFYDGACAPESLPDNADEVVDNWAKEHPLITYADDFFKKFPNAKRNESGLPSVCLHDLYGNITDCCNKSCYKCWSSEVKEEI